MIKLQLNHIKYLKITTALIYEECQKRGWGIYVNEIGSSNLYIDRKDGKDSIHLYSSTPPSTTYAAAQTANNKYESYLIMKNHGLPVLDTLIYQRENLETIKQWMIEGSVVVKPSHGAHGFGITTNVSTEAKLQNAIHDALNAQTDKGKVIIQKFYSSPIDLRVLCINNTFVSAVHRIAARVIGDGVHTLEELIIRENETKRGTPYVDKQAKIDI